MIKRPQSGATPRPSDGINDAPALAQVMVMAGGKSATGTAAINRRHSLMEAASACNFNRNITEPARVDHNSIGIPSRRYFRYVPPNTAVWWLADGNGAPGRSPVSNANRSWLQPKNKYIIMMRTRWRIQ